MGRTVSLFAVVATAMLLALGGVALAATSVSGVPDAASVQVDGRNTSTSRSSHGRSRGSVGAERI